MTRCCDNGDGWICEDEMKVEDEVWKRKQESGEAPVFE